VTNNSIDFQADLIAYPVMLDTYSFSIPVPTGEVDLNINGVDADLEQALLMNKRFEMKNKFDGRIHSKTCANNCKA